MERHGRRKCPTAVTRPAGPARRAGRRATAPRGVCALAGLLVLAGAVPATAQVLVGPSAGQGGTVVTNERSGNVVVNPGVLDSLGPGPGAGAPGYSSPGYGTATPVPPAATPGTPYPAPGSGSLVISRPGTLLFPPEHAPRSRLTLPPPSGRRATAEAHSGSGNQLRSRLLVERPQHLHAPAPRAATPAPVARPKPPTVAQPKPVEPEAPTPATPKVAETPPADSSETPVAAETPALSAAPDQAEPPAPPPAKPRPMAQAQRESPEPAPATPPQAESTPSLPPPPPAKVAAVPEKAEPAPAPPEATEPAPQPEAATTAKAPPPTPAPEPAASAQTAARTSGTAITERRIVFDGTSADLSEAAEAELTALAEALKEDPAARVQLLAYAQDRGEGSSRARRVSLSRALSVRAFLIDQGIRSTRMDVRALGDKAEDGPSERVDILPQETRQ